MVSPAKTGAGSVTLSQPRLATTFWLMSGTLSPVTRDRVRQLFMSGRPNSDRAAKSALKWIWLVLQVSRVNQVLSTSVSVRPSWWRYTSPTLKSSK